MNKLLVRLKLFWRTLDKKTISIWTVSFLVVNSVTAAFSVLYADTLSNAANEVVSDDISSGIETVDIDTIGTDPFIEVGLISNSNEKLESYYAITSQGYLYTWGWNLNGELGLGIEDDYVANPTFVNLDGSYDDINENSIRDNGEVSTITEGDKVKKITHINSTTSTNNAGIFAISQEDYLYMWGSSELLPNYSTSEYYYSTSKLASDENNYISPIFVNLDNSYLQEDGTDAEIVARDADGILYKDSSNNIIDIKVPTKTEGDKVKDVDMFATTKTNYGGIVLSYTGELYGWGKNSNKVLDYQKSESDYINDLSKIEYETSDTADIPYEKAEIVGISKIIIVALGTDGYIYEWGYSALIPTVDVNVQPTSPRVKVDVNDPTMSLDTTHSSRIVDFSVSAYHASLQLINEEGYIYSIGGVNNKGASGRYCIHSLGYPEDEKFYRIDLNCNTTIDDDKVKYVNISDLNSMLIDENNYLHTYGWNNAYQSGIGHNYPVMEPNMIDIDQDGETGLSAVPDADDKVIVANNDNPNHTGAITESGDLYLWGYNSAEYGIMPDTSNNAFNTTFAQVPTKVNFSEYEEGEKYQTLVLWNFGGVTSTDALNIYSWGSFDPSEERVDANLSKVHKVTKEEFVTNAVAIK